MDQRLAQRLTALITTRYNGRNDDLAIGQRDIARLWCVDERTVKRDMARLRSLGWATVKRQGAGTGALRGSGSRRGRGGRRAGGRAAIGGIVIRAAQDSGIDALAQAQRGIRPVFQNVVEILAAGVHGTDMGLSAPAGLRAAAMAKPPSAFPLQTTGLFSSSSFIRGAPQSRPAFSAG
ncbi:hypothetical protein EYF88_09045 [Paracoccus sediminis]|uniref:DeoR-like helix-turn-helix domain-containing protein n=1 Tax=Paracoccus sediminis TaxID=1214787 RepID=A0ABY1YI97_9RHOB|nr:hypothetical protein EYF88_09045 [Paracoccus sediminis]